MPAWAPRKGTPPGGPLGISPYVRAQACGHMRIHACKGGGGESMRTASFAGLSSSAGKPGKMECSAAASRSSPRCLGVM